MNNSISFREVGTEIDGSRRGHGRRSCKKGGIGCGGSNRRSNVVSPSAFKRSCGRATLSKNKASNFLPEQHLLTLQSNRCPATVSRTFLWLLVCFLVTGGTLAAEPFISPSACKYPHVDFALVKPLSPPRGGVYLNGSKAHVECYSNFRVKNGDPMLTCNNAEWMGSGGRPVECELSYPVGETTCGTKMVPEIDHGFYNILPEEASSQPKDGRYPVGTELQAGCIPTFALNCSHHRQFCGRISCQDGRWFPRDGQLVKACVAKPVVQGVNGDDDRTGQKTSSSLKNYLILALALVCIFVVGALTVALLRRPLFCKKREQNQGDGPVVITSASPNHQGGCGSDLDSLPVAMNTGIFLPGAGYDLQDCQIQDVPFVGTTVFK